MPARKTATTMSYTNRLGATFYLHEGQTKTGKSRYFVAKTVGEKALSSMPEGYEFSESINGVVSVRRVSSAASKIPDTDLAMARAELRRHKHLGRHRVEAVKDEILIYEPVGGISPHTMADMSLVFGLTPDLTEARLGNRQAGVKYDPVMKFVPEDPGGHYAVHRMTYRGHGGWSYPLDSGPLQKLVKKYLKHVGTEEFFELM